MNMPIDEQFLEAMGAGGLKGKAKQQTIDDILYTLNISVGRRIAETLNGEQLDKLNDLLDRNPSQPELEEWLEQNIPDYKRLIQEEAEKMRDEMLAIRKNLV